LKLAGASCLAAVALFGSLQWLSARQTIELGFWFEDVTYELPRLRAEGMDPLTTAEQQTIQRIARAEVERAFAGLRVRVTDSRRAHYRVSVEQVFQGRRFQGAAGLSRALIGAGGAGAVNFLVVADFAVVHAPPDATRVMIVAGIGRGIGRSAVHELAHQIVPNVSLHDSPDPESYEYGSADRFSHYYGVERWGPVGLHLARRYGSPGFLHAG
jgi:hypothetical protein